MPCKRFVLDCSDSKRRTVSDSSMKEKKINTTLKMWATELYNVNDVAHALQARGGRYAIIDTIIYALMSLRQTPVPTYYFVAESTTFGMYCKFLVAIGKHEFDGHNIGSVFIRILLLNRFYGQLNMDIQESQTGVLQSVVEGDWDDNKVRGYLCSHLSADVEYTVNGAYDDVSQQGRHAFESLLHRTTTVAFKRTRFAEKFGLVVLPPPVKRKGSLKRKWKRTSTLISTGLPTHISGTRVPRRAPSPVSMRQRSPRRPMSPPPRYSRLHRSPTPPTRATSKRRSPIRMNANL